MRLLPKQYHMHFKVIMQYIENPNSTSCAEPSKALHIFKVKQWVEALRSLVLEAMQHQRQIKSA